MALVHRTIFKGVGKILRGIVFAVKLWQHQANIQLRSPHIIILIVGSIHGITITIIITKSVLLSFTAPILILHFWVGDESLIDLVAGIEFNRESLFIPPTSFCGDQD